nr:MAG TPA: hypothetical protein [Caudoviricetes sp.]
MHLIPIIFPQKINTLLPTQKIFLKKHIYKAARLWVHVECTKKAQVRACARKKHL